MNSPNGNSEMNRTDTIKEIENKIKLLKDEQDKERPFYKLQSKIVIMAYENAKELIKNIDSLE